MTLSTNAKFSIISKSGKSTIMSFDSYKDAQKYADSHFGKGCIIQVIGNRCCNSIVANAIAGMQYI